MKENFFNTLRHVKNLIECRNYDEIIRIVDRRLVFYVCMSPHQVTTINSYFPVQFFNHALLFHLLSNCQLNSFHYKILYYLIDTIDFNYYIVAMRMNCVLSNAVHNGNARLVKYCLHCGFLPDARCLEAVKKSRRHSRRIARLFKLRNLM